MRCVIKACIGLNVLTLQHSGQLSLIQRRSALQEAQWRHLRRWLALWPRGGAVVSGALFAPPVRSELRQRPAGGGRGDLRQPLPLQICRRPSAQLRLRVALGDGARVGQCRSCRYRATAPGNATAGVSHSAAGWHSVQAVNISSTPRSPVDHKFFLAHARLCRSRRS